MEGVASMTFNNKWTEEMVAEVRILAEKGGSFASIAMALNREFKTDFTRSAVLGKCHRLKISTRNIAANGHTFVNRKGGRPRNKQVQIASFVYLKNRTTPPRPPKVIEPPSPPYEEGEGIEAEALTGDVCHWPLGGFKAVMPYRYCGQARHAGSYCRHHHQGSLRKNEQKRS